MNNFNKTLLIIVITVLIIAVLIAVLRTIYFYKREHFVCPKCKKSFIPKVSSLFLSMNAVEGTIIKCPYCGAKEYVEPVKNKKTTT